MKSKNLIAILISCMFLSGCSMIPRITFDSKNTVPQQTEKSKIVEKCIGDYKLNQDGYMISCSKGYYSNKNLYNKVERRTTIKERIINFFRNLVGSSFWIILALIILCPSLLGFIIGKIIESTVGITGRALKSTVKAVRNAKRNGGHFMDELDREHSKDKNVQMKINKLRAEE